MKKYGRMYTYAGYGGRFRVRLSSMDTKPYNSLAMVQPCEYPLVLG